MKKLKILSLFAGIGSFEKALSNLEIPFELVGFSEIDKFAVKSYCAIHGVPEELNLGDITKIDETKLPKDIDLITYGFPCVPKGYMVKTTDGYKPIEDVVEGDRVLTHTNTYHTVVRTMNRVSDHINIIKGVGCYALELTDEHPVYTYDGRSFTWVKAKELTMFDKLVYNINTNSVDMDFSDDELWLMGRYCADGYKEKNSLHRNIFCIGKAKTDEFERHIGGVKFATSHSERSCVEYKIMDSRLNAVLKAFGTGSLGKHIPNEIVNLPKERLALFLEGYLSGDGHRRKDRATTMFSTVNKGMFLSLQEIIIKVHRLVPTVTLRKDTRKSTFSDTYNVQWSEKAIGQIVVGDKIIVPIKSITREVRDTEVFNFEVDTDNSYTVNNVIVHNCQDISLAGRQKGMFNEDGSKTRSGLFFEAFRIIEATKPRVAIAENVKNLVGKKFKEQFEIVLSCLEYAGYNNYWKVLNAKDFGVPQNRERVFIISIRKDIDTGTFRFPEGFPLQKRLKDILEDEVEDKYYVSHKAVKYITDKDRLEKKYTSINGDISLCLTAKGNNNWTGTFISDDPKVNQIGNCFPTNNRDNPNQGRIYDKEGLPPSLNCMQGGNRQPFITIENNEVRIREATSKGYSVAVWGGDSINMEQPNSKTRRGRVGKQVAQTLTTSPQQGVVIDED